MALGLISIHAERAFPPEGELFTRRKFGLPFFWSGHAQVGASLLILFGTQIVGWLAGLYDNHRFLNIDWPGNWLTQHFLLAGGLWLAGVYAYLYSDLVVRRVGVYTCLAAFCVVMAEATIAGRFLAGEGWIAVLAVTALGVNLVQMFMAKTNEKIARVLPPLAMVLGVLPILIGLLLHIRATSAVAAELNWEYATGWPFVVVMLLVAACNRMSAHLFSDTSPRWSAVNMFASAAALLVAAAGLLRVLELTRWTQQAPWLMLIPIAYIVAARLGVATPSNGRWAGSHTPQRPSFCSTCWSRRCRWSSRWCSPCSGPRTTSSWAWCSPRRPCSTFWRPSFGAQRQRLFRDVGSMRRVVAVPGLLRRSRPVLHDVVRGAGHRLFGPEPHVGD